MSIPASVRAKLPKSKLCWVRFRVLRIRGYSSRFAKFRNANAMFVWIGPLEIGWRMPWLEQPARQIYPHLFTRTALATAPEEK